MPIKVITLHVSLVLLSLTAVNAQTFYNIARLPNGATFQNGRTIFGGTFHTGRLPSGATYNYGTTPFGGVYNTGTTPLGGAYNYHRSPFGGVYGTTYTPGGGIYGYGSRPLFGGLFGRRKRDTWRELEFLQNHYA